MDLLVWITLATVLLVAVQAGPTDKGPQMFSEEKPAEPKQKIHKRQPKYEMQMKEVILYLTPSQIRALEAGEGFIQPQQGSVQPQLAAQSEQAPLNDHIKEHIQNVLKEEAQKQHRESEKVEVNRKQQMQLKEAKQNKQSKKSKDLRLSPENNAPQSPQSDLQKREKYHEFPLQFQLIPQFDHQTLLRSAQPVPSIRPDAIPNIEHQVIQAQLSHLDAKLVPNLQTAVPQIEQVAIPQENTHWRPQNYAYLYFYPGGKPVNSEKNELFYPDVREQRPKQLLQHTYPELPFSPKFGYSLVPYEYGYQSKLEAQQILQSQLQNHVLNAHRLESQNLEARRLKPHQLEIDPREILAHKDVEAHYVKPQQLEIDPHEILAHEDVEAHHLKPQQLEIDPQEILAHKDLEAQYVYENPRNLEGYQTAERMVEQQVEAGRLKGQNSNIPELQEELKPPKAEEATIDLKKLEDIERQQMEEVLQARKLKANLEAQEREAHRLDAQLEAEQIKAEKMRQEQERLAFLRQLEPKRTQMHSILKPLFQGHNIAESLEKQKANFPHDKINVQKGFRPLQYAPEYNDEKYRKEVEKILRRNEIEKQKALAKAAAIANEPPEIIMSKEENFPKQQSVEIVNQVSVPTPVYLPVPQPFEVKVPQPYAVPLEIIRPIPVPIVKMEKVEVEKPVPVEIEKRVPVPVTKNVYVPVDKPYFVEKVVPVEVQKKIPVEVPIRNRNQKLTIIRHVWEQ